MLNKLARMRAAPRPINDLLEAVDDCREQIAGLRSERARVAAAPRPASEILADIDEALDGLATAAIDRLQLHRLIGRKAPAEIRVPLAPGRDLAEQYVNTEVAARTLFGLIIAAAREPLRAVLAGQIEDRLDGRECLTDTEIEARVSEIDRLILAAELSEEAATRTLEAAGIEVQRRGDADPLVVLAADDALPRG